MGTGCVVHTSGVVMATLDAKAWGGEESRDHVFTEGRASVHEED